MSSSRRRTRQGQTQMRPVSPGKAPHAGEEAASKSASQDERVEAKREPPAACTTTHQEPCRHPHSPGAPRWPASRRPRHARWLQQAPFLILQPPGLTARRASRRRFPQQSLEMEGQIEQTERRRERSEEAHALEALVKERVDCQQACANRCGDDRPLSRTHGASAITFMGTPAPHSCSRCATGLMLLAVNPDAVSNARSSSPATRSSTSGGTAS